MNTASGSANSSNLPCFQDLMDPQVFPEAQCGMKVESAHLQGALITVKTTGSIIKINTLDGRITLHQRIGHRRLVASLVLGTALRGAAITHSTVGCARITFEQPKMTVRINGDSLLLLHAHEDVVVHVFREIPVAWSASYGLNHLLVDEWGGLALYCSEGGLDSRFDLAGEPLAVYHLPENAVLAAGVCPPKPYDWDASLQNQVVWHHTGTKTENYPKAYPTEAEMAGWGHGGNIVLLQSEIALWKDWLLDFEPRFGEQEFFRVRDWLRKRGMRLIVYTSPYYFVRGTDQESLAFNDWAVFKNLKWPVDGANIEVFLAAITRVMERLKPDGLYFDGQYADNPAALYALARRSRGIIGEKGLLEWHSTFELGIKGNCYMPHADAYTDFQLRGEGASQRYGSFEYLRYFVSGYNISNSIGVLCNNYADTVVSPDRVEDILRANCRLHTFCSAPGAANTGHVLVNPTYVRYWSRLTRDLQAEVDRHVDVREDLLATGQRQT